MYYFKLNIEGFFYRKNKCLSYKNCKNGFSLIQPGLDSRPDIIYVFKLMVHALHKFLQAKYDFHQQLRLIDEQRQRIPQMNLLKVKNLLILIS